MIIELSRSFVMEATDCRNYTGTQRDNTIFKYNIKVHSCVYLSHNKHCTISHSSYSACVCTIDGRKKSIYIEFLCGKNIFNVIFGMFLCVSEFRTKWYSCWTANNCVCQKFFCDVLYVFFFSKCKWTHTRTCTHKPT